MSKNFRSVLLGIDGATHNLHRDGGPNGGPTGGFSAPAAEVNGVTSMNITDPAAVAATGSGGERGSGGTNRNEMYSSGTPTNTKTKSEDDDEKVSALKLESFRDQESLPPPSGGSRLGSHLGAFFIVFFSTTISSLSYRT